MFDPDLFVDALYSETVVEYRSVDDIVANSLPCNDPSCSYDSGWVDGALIQDVMPHLKPEEREFLMTGITPAEWDAMFA